jgi:hypothetical protein
MTQPHICLDCQSHGLCPWKSEGVRVSACTEYHPAPTPAAPVPATRLLTVEDKGRQHRHIFSATFRRLLR